MKLSRIAIFATITIICIAAFTRLFMLSSLPISPYWEEVALGYDAYSLLKTGKDHHGNSWPILAVESFGDWKPSGYFYATMPTIAIFDLTVLAVRLPSAIAGILIVLGVGLLAHALKGNFLLALFLATISPWAIQFSRGAWEVNLATACLLWGIVFLIYSFNTVRSSKTFKVLSVLLIVYSAYTYHAARVVAPLLWGVVWLPYIFSGKEITKRIISFIPYALGVTVLILPIILSVRDPKISQRFQETSIFSDTSIVAESNARREYAGNSLASNFFYNRRVLYSREIMSNMLKHFDPQFLFISGDENPRHSTGLFGIFYSFEIVFLTVGFMYVLFRGTLYQRFLLVWVFIALIPIALTKDTPHALRFLLAMPALMIIIQIGIQQILEKISSKKFVGGMISYKQIGFLALGFLYIFSFSMFWRHYSTVYKIKSASEWQYGYEQLMKVVSQYKSENQNASIAISRQLGRPAMYYWFYTATNPKSVQALNSYVTKDQGEYLQFEGISFFDSLSELDSVRPSMIAVTAIENHSISQEYTLQESIESPDGKVIWYIFSLK
ncbi:MAG: hypothetical protein WAU07_04870 [Microgenomates group bacterium]